MNIHTLHTKSSAAQSPSLAPATLANQIAPAIFAPVLKAAPQPGSHHIAATAPQNFAANTGWQSPDDADAVPAWLISARRATPGGHGAPAAPLSAMATDGSVPAFESDDDALNSFAARYRAAPDDDSPAARQAAIARLQSLIARVRAA